MKNFVFAFAIMFGSTLAYTQTFIGKWTTVDDVTGKKKSTVELYKYKDQLFGKITYLYPYEGLESNPICKKCTDDRKNKSIEGLQVVRNLKWNGKEWEGGTILDPENGKIYRVTMWLDTNDSNKLNVRGYIGPFFRTQTWVRVKE